MVRKIITHPGAAHKDDFLACCLMVHVHGVPVLRKEPEQEELDDPGIVVIDVGHQHDSAKKNFDHHQFPADHPPICALSLVLQDLGLYEDALSFCAWLEPAEWLDSRGPNDTADWLEVDREVIGKLNSPMDVTLLRRFALCSELDRESPLWQIMNMVGEDLVTYLETLRARLEFIGEHAEFWTLGTGQKTHEVLYLPRTDPLPEEASAGLELFVREKGKEDRVVALVYPDRRGEGYGLSRFDDNRAVDFSSLEENCDDVHFSHKRGFVCKTSATDPARLRELIEMALDSADRKTGGGEAL